MQLCVARIRIFSEKCVIRQLDHWVDILECTYTKLDGLAHHTPKLHGIAIVMYMWSIIDQNIMRYLTLSGSL